MLDNPQYVEVGMQCDNMLHDFAQLRLVIHIIPLRDYREQFRNLLPTPDTQLRDYLVIRVRRNLARMDRLVPAHPAFREDLAASGEVAFRFAEVGKFAVVWERDERVGIHDAVLCFASLAFLLLAYANDATANRRTSPLGVTSVFRHDYRGGISVRTDALRDDVLGNHGR